MAEIKIEKKKPLWPWILLLSILAVAVILYFMTDTDYDTVYPEEEIEEIDDTDNIGTLENSDDIGEDETITYGQAFSRQESDRIMMDYRSSIYDSVKVGTDINQTKIAMTKLFDAVEIKARQFNFNSNTALEELRSELKTDSNDFKAEEISYTSSDFKKNAKSITAVLNSIQDKQFPSMDNDIMKLEMTVNSIDTSKELKEQSGSLNTFFNSAADLLNNMN